MVTPSLESEEPKRKPAQGIEFRSDRARRSGEEKFLGDIIIINPNKMLEESIKTAIGTAVGFWVTNVLLEQGED